MTDWTTQTLGVICDEVNGVIRTGPFGSQLHESDYKEVGLPVVMPKDIVDGKISVDTIAKIGDQDATRLSQHKLRLGDIVYGRRGDIGRCALIMEREAGWLCGTGCLRLSFGDAVLDPRFLFYYLRQPQVVTWIAQQAVGATLPNLNTTIMRSIQVTYPSLPLQCRIADILSAYDDLIETNTRRIQVLERMAQLLYEEWFVYFRFPSHEQVAWQETELGEVPEGWEVRKLGEVAKEVRHSVHPTEIDADTPYFGLEHLPRKSLALSDWGRADGVQSTKLIFRKGEILFGKIRPYFHKVGVAPVDGVCSSDTIVIRPQTPEHFALVLGCIFSEDLVTYATQTSQGTKMPRANWDVMAQYPVAIPPQALCMPFNEFVGTIVEQIHVLIFTIRNLRYTRDLLLPRLVSGEIEINKLSVQ